MSADLGAEAEIGITGAGVAACLGLDLESIWLRVKAGECGIGAMPALETPLPPGKDGGQAPDLPAEFWPEVPREARYLRWTIDAALTDARVDLYSFDPSRVGLLLGTTLHGMRAGGEFLRTGDYTRLNRFLAGDVTRLATRGLSIGGLSATTCSACSSSLGAIALAVTALERGEADLVIAGGYDAVSEYAYAGFGSLRLISDGPLRPFARGRTGMKVAEGYGIVVLERVADAHRRGGSVRAIVAGWGESADAFHLTRPHPEGSGALAAMRQAVCRAGIEPSHLDLIAAHATGTPDNDSSEAAASTALLGDASRSVSIVGFKSHLGHTLGGAGAVELALSAMALRDGVIPPTANSSPENVDYPTLNLNTVLTARTVTHTLNTSLGFGGANTCVVLRAPGLPPALNDARSHRSPAPRSAPISIDVVITGIGVLVPGAIGNEAFVELAHRTKRVDSRTIEDALYEPIIPNARRLRRMSTYVKLSICAAVLAARDAKLLDSPELLRDTGAILGTTHGSAGYCYNYYEQVVREGLATANPVLFAEGVPNAAAAQLSLTLGLTGACQTILGTRTAGIDALRLAAMRIAAGDVERLIVCAAEESFHVLDAAYESCGQRPSVSLAVSFVLESRGAAERRGADARAVVGKGNTGRRDEKQVGDSPLPFGGGSAFSVEPLLALAYELLGTSNRSLRLRGTDGDHATLVGVSAAD